MPDKMLKFVKIGQQNPPKREVDLRKEDFNEIYDEFISNGGWVNSKTNGKMRLEGKDYIVRDGDILNFRFNT